MFTYNLFIPITFIRFRLNFGELLRRFENHRINAFSIANEKLVSREVCALSLWDLTHLSMSFDTVDDAKKMNRCYGTARSRSDIEYQYFLNLIDYILI